MLRAFAADPDYVGYWDADLSTPLDAIQSFFSLLDSRRDIEMVFGARVSLLGRAVERNPLRHYLGRVFATAASLALGIGILRHPMRGEALPGLARDLALFQSPFSTRWIFDVEIIARLVASRERSDRPGLTQIVYEFPCTSGAMSPVPRSGHTIS